MSLISTNEEGLIKDCHACKLLSLGSEDQEDEGDMFDEYEWDEYNTHGDWPMEEE